jgi:ribosomal protein S8E
MKPDSLIVLMPTRGIIITETEDSLEHELVVNQLVPLILRTHDQPLPVSRNFLVESALKIEGWTHALLLDDDVILPKGGLKQLFALNTDVAIMDYPMQGKLEGKSVGTVVHDKDKSVAFAGLGAVLVKRAIFETIGSPWFVLTQYRINRSKDGQVGFYAGQPDGKPMTFSAGEDTYFYLQVRKHNFKIKETKKKAKHARIDQLVTNTHTTRYGRQHMITQSDTIERELL